MKTQKKQPQPQPQPKTQAERFVEAAKRIGCDEVDTALDAAFGRIDVAVSPCPNDRAPKKAS